MRVLITRPEPGASATAARLVAMGHAPLVAPCLNIFPLKLRLVETPAAIVITSGQAIPALPAAFCTLPVFCVGDATAGRLREAGFCRVESAGGNAQDLFRLLTARRLPGTHLLAAGERQGFLLLRQLRDAGITVLRRKTYAAKPVKTLPPQASAALAERQLDAVLFYSAATARGFVRLKPPHTEALVAYALSAAVAAPLQALPWRQIRVALAPSEADLMAMLT